MTRDGVLCVIAARGGSRGIPGKNLRPLLGKPLIVWSIEQALQTPEIDRVVVSTDDEKIAEVARKAGAAVPFMRPAEFATAEAGKFAVWRHALAATEKALGESYHVFIDLDCTGPVRTPSDISAALRQFRSGRDGGVKAVMSVAPARRNPYFNLLEAGQDGALRPAKAQGEVLRRQDAPECFDAIASIYVLDCAYVRNATGLFEGRVDGFVMQPEQAFDIDDELDFRIVEMVLRERQGAHAP
jgi:CMP-N-acetylneuraminic acid synthetase